ncbi:MAG TPA: hypothetical protein VE978_05175 [Chitinophagales bacterium]|nr:hypothetical protein [Chitinophagales bacterium]
MSASALKGKLLEFFVRRIFFNCGFTEVKADGIYMFENQGLFFINGKGAAHDADVLMDPPVQIPFAYPFRLLFECKSYESKVRISVARNALGLREDINAFEIVTLETIAKRKNNRRAEYAIENRRRHFYQVGVAALHSFTPSAVEFAANNKIPLFSLEWLLPQSVLSKIDSIDDALVQTLGTMSYSRIKKYFGDRRKDARDHHAEALSGIGSNQLLREIISEFDETLRSIYIGIIETGDLIFLKFNSESSRRDPFLDSERFSFRAAIHWRLQNPELWSFQIFTNDYNDRNGSAFYDFFLPKSISVKWRKSEYDKMQALNLKGEFFSRIFIFNKERSTDFPFYLINLDEEWLNSSRDILNIEESES